MAEILMVAGGIGTAIVVVNSVYNSYKKEKAKLEEEQIVVYDLSK